MVVTDNRGLVQYCQHLSLPLLPTFSGVSEYQQWHSLLMALSATGGSSVGQNVV